jgi:hypothetical protein
VRSARLLLFTNIALALYATVALAQVPAEPITNATNQLIDQGAWGALVVLEGIAIFLLFKDLKSQHEQTLAWAVKATDVLATTMQGAQKTEAALQRTAEQLAKYEATTAKYEATLAGLVRILERFERGSGGSRGNPEV